MPTPPNWPVLLVRSSQELQDKACKTPRLEDFTISPVVRMVYTGLPLVINKKVSDHLLLVPLDPAGNQRDQDMENHRCASGGKP